MTTEKKLLKLRKLADAMYYAAQYLTTDASRLHKAMDEYHQFIIHEYHNVEPTIAEIVDEHWWEMLGEEPMSEDLEKEMQHYFCKEWAGDPVVAARHFANWQKQKDAEALNENALLYIARLEGIEIGKAEMKQQMMKNAKDGVITFDYYGDNDKIYGCIAHDSFCLEELGLKDGDKVKLIIIKEE